MKDQERFTDLRHRINMYFDHELSTEDENALLQQVDDDPRCGKMFEKEKNFRDFVKNNVKRPSVSPDLIRTIKDRIRPI